jgi:hypothetical protein
MLHELLDQFAREEQALNLEKMGRIAASIACRCHQGQHAARAE